MTLAAVLRHLVFAAALALLSAAVVRGMITVRLLDRPDPRKVHTRATPKGGGVGVVVGLLAALLGILVAYYAVAGSILLVGALTMLLGLTRIFLPGLWDQLLMAGFIQINGPPAEFLDRLTPPDQGLVMILCASLLVASGLGMLWLGRYFLRGLRFLFSLVLEWVRRFAQSIRRKLRRGNREEPLVGAVSFVK